LIEPLDWDETINLPSDKQLENMEIIVNDRKQKIESVLHKKVSMVPYSSKKGFNLQILFSALIEACPEERSWIFQDLKNFEPEDFVPVDAFNELKKS
jgi:predicted GTPase